MAATAKDIANWLHLPGTLTQEERSKAADLLFEKLGPRSCEMCGATAWSVGDYIVSPLILQVQRPDNFSVDVGNAIPSLHVVCTNCGNTKLFHLGALGFKLTERPK